MNQILATTIDMRTFSGASEPETAASLILSEGGIASYSVAENGTLVYLSGHLDLPPIELDRTGRLMTDFREEPLGVWSWNVAREHPWLFLANEGRGLYRYNWETGALAEPLNTVGLLPIAGPGDTLVAFLNWEFYRPGCSVGVLHVNRGQVDTVLTGRPCLYPTDWSPDGRELLLSDGISWLNPDVRVPTLWTYAFADGVVRPLAQESGAMVSQGTYSPDGRWVAYMSDRIGGRPEVYVQRRDGSSRPVVVSRNGGAWPRWRRDSRELYFLGPAGRVFVAQMPFGDPPTSLFSVPGWTGLSYRDAIGTLFDVTPDGTRFFVRRASIEPRHLVVIQNWIQP